MDSDLSIFEKVENNRISFNEFEENIQKIAKFLSTYLQKKVFK